MEDRVLALGEIAWDVLRRMVRELLARKAGGHLIEGSLQELELKLPLVIQGARAGPRAFSEELVASLDGLLDEAVQHAAAWRPGHAFCYRCRGALCEHSLPPSNRHVFVGYGPTGHPRWEDFAQRCLDIRHPDVDLLYGQPPAFVTLVQDGGELNGNLLGAFSDAGTCELLGQVLAGFFPVRAREGEGRGIVALTFQVAASHPRNGWPRLGLNILGRTPQGESLDMLWERHDEIPWRSAVLWAQAALLSVARRHHGHRGRARQERAWGDTKRSVGGILSGLARRMERDQRARSRRTQHAEHRHLAGDRPTRQALEDARKAKPETILVDERNGTWVVSGERGRTHFFSPEGRLVSSVRYSREAIARKRKSGLWREAGPSEALGLLEKIGAAEVDEDSRPAIMPP